MSLRELRFLRPVVAALLAGCGARAPRADLAGAAPALVTDRRRCEVRLTATVQRTDAPRMNGWGRAVPALLGARGGKFEKYFVFLTDASVRDTRDALIELGAAGTVVYELAEAVRRKGLRADNTPADYLQGSPVQIFVEWRERGRIRRRAYEEFFLEKIAVGTAETVKPWTPHFVFHGSGVLNHTRTGCIACAHDCPGGIIANNQYPLIEPRPCLRADWRKLPGPGTAVTVVLRPVPSGGARQRSER